MSRSLPRSPVALAAALVALWIPAAARATVYCVVHTGDCGAGQVTEGSVQAALDAASADQPGPNIVSIGPGQFDALGAGFDYSAPGAPAVKVIGAGPGQTTLDSPSGAPFILRLGANGATVTDLTVAFSAPSTAGLVLTDATTAQGVTVTGTGPMPAADGVQLSGGATFAEGTITLPDTSQADVDQVAGGTGTVKTSTLTGNVGLMTSGDEQPALQAADVTILAATSAAQVAAGGTMDVQTALILMHGADPSALLATGGTLNVASSTIVGLAGGGFGGSVAGTDHAPASLSVLSSIIRGFDSSLRRSTSGDGTAATLTAEYDDLHPATTSPDPVPGTITFDHDIDVDPTFVNAAAGDYHLLAHSPAIDAGGACDAACFATPELGGLGRPIDGDGDGDAVRDMGAYEYGHHPPGAVVAAAGGIQAGSPVLFDGSSSSDPDDGDVLTYAWTFDDGSTATGPRVMHTFTTAGEHPVTLTVTDPTGLSSTAHSGATVLPGPPAPRFPIHVHRTRPVVAGLRMAAPIFAVGPGVTARGARRRRNAPPVGSAFSFSLSETAGLTVAIQRVTGRQSSHRRCNSGGRRAKPCPPVAPLATLHRAAVRAGRVRIAFSGRIGARVLGAGRYEATLIATDSAGTSSKPARVRFTVVAH